MKTQEQLFFEAQVEEALDFLRRARGSLTYAHILRVHGILFDEFYPWAGKDRRELGVGHLVGKGAPTDPFYVQFESSEKIRLAAEWGLRLGNDARHMRKQPGTVMGALAWAHPFLDGNGRALLLVHAELCHRAGFSIDWPGTDKNSYLRALSQELREPEKHLDAFLLPLVRPLLSSGDLLGRLLKLPGLAGKDTTSIDNVVYGADDKDAVAAYREMKRSRGEEPDAR